MNQKSSFSYLWNIRPWSVQVKYNRHKRRKTDEGNQMKLSEMKISESAVIKEVGGQGALRQHFPDMGVIPGSEEILVKFAQLGDPMELMIHGYELTLRLEDAEKIEVILMEKTKENWEQKNAFDTVVWQCLVAWLAAFLVRIVLITAGIH